MKTLRSTALLLAAAVCTAAQPARRSVSLIITSATVVTQDARHSLLTPGAIAINGADIVDIGPPASVTAKYRASETIDARDEIVLPGLINTHTHAPMVMYR